MRILNNENTICQNCDNSHFANGLYSARTVDIVYELDDNSTLIYNGQKIKLLQCEIGCLLPCIKGLIKNDIY